MTKIAIIPPEQQLLLGKKIKLAKKGKDISVYPGLIERSIIPEDECCKKVCSTINDMIDNTMKGVRMCEEMVEFGMKGVCYTKWKHDMDAMTRLRKNLKEQEVCKCYE